MSGRFKEVVSQLLGALETSTGQDFLERFVAQVAELFATDYAAVTLVDATDTDRLQTLAVYGEGRILANTTWPLAGSPGAEVIDSAAPCIFRTRVQEKFPADETLQRSGAFCYAGVPLFASSGDILGLCVIMDQEAIADDLFAVEVLQLFADRLVAEIKRLCTDMERQQYQQQLEERVSRCDADLETTRHELEALGYSVSHDLRGPLRAIDGFSEILATDYADKLDATAGDYLHRIRNNARNMDALLHALLIMSRVTRHQLCLSEVNLSRICARSIERLQQRDPHRRVSVSIQSGIHACSDPELMTIALDHLIDNAWKYSTGTDQAHIEFSADRQDGVTVYRLADNGAGFDMAYIAKLFELFQRLHGQQVYAGVGAGLAIVKRIIERHGGRIWAQAAPEAGATFYFILPLAPVGTCSDQVISAAD